MSKDDMTPRKRRCSFCGKSAEQVRRLVAGPGAYICNECIALCNRYMGESYDYDEPELNLGSLPKPKEIKEILLNAFGVFTIIQSEIISISLKNYTPITPTNL